MVTFTQVRREFSHFGIDWSGIIKPLEYAQEVWPAVVRQ
jgi:hypothetical protein